MKDPMFPLAGQAPAPTGERPRIVVTARIHDAVRAELEALGEVVANESVEPWSPERLRAELAGATALMGFMPDRVDARLLAAAPRLRIVAAALKGFDNYDAEACRQAGVWLTIVPDLLTVPTAELTVGLMLGLGRHLLAGDAYVRSGAFAGWRPHLYGTGLAGSRVAIVGAGAVGRAVAERLAGFGCTLAYWDARRLPANEEARLRMAWAPLETLLPQADYVVSGLPLADGTLHLLGADAIARMKPGALLVNPSRGSVIDEAAVADALAAGHLGGYAADVFECEDWARGDRPRDICPRLLQDRARTLFTPHLGSAVQAVRLAIEREAAANIADFLAGRRPRGAVGEPIAARCAA